MPQPVENGSETTNLDVYTIENLIDYNKGKAQSATLNNHNNPEGNIEEALEATGNGKFNYWLTFAGGIILYAVNSECYSIGYVIPSAECDMNLDLQEKTILVTVGSVGIVTTQLLWGYLSDRIGRRQIMLWTLLLGCLCTILSVLVPMFWLVSLFRFLNGAFVACASGLSFAYVGEFFCDRYRSVYIMIMSICIGIVLTLIPLLAWIVIPMDFHILFFGQNLASWRIFLLLSGLPTIPACIILYFCPESPKFLANAQRPDECLKVLRKMHKMNNDKTEYAVEKIICSDPKSSKQGNFLHLFGRQFICKTLLVCALQGGIFATSGGLLLWYPDILQRVSKSTQDITVCEALNLPVPIVVDIVNIRLGSGADAPIFYTAQNATRLADVCGVTVDNSVYFQNILIGIAYTIGYVLISFLISIIGIRHILMIFLSLAGFASLALYWITTQLIIDILFLGLLVLSGLCVVVVNAAVVELYPTNLRGMAVCIAMLSGRFGSIISSSVVGYLLMWNCNVTFMLYAASLIGCSLLAFLLPNKNHMT